MMQTGTYANEFKDLSRSYRLPLPPKFKVKKMPSLPYQVPPFFSFDHPSTRWILAMICSSKGVRRLHEVGMEYPHIFSTYYQIPDRPGFLLRNNKGTQVPAYNSKAILYLTPLALAVYLRSMDAVRVMVRIKDKQGRHLSRPNLPCFAQKVCKRGMEQSSNDLINTSAALIAVRRQFFEAIYCLMEANYAPQECFTVVYRKPCDEVVHVYRDLLDYAVAMLKNRPGVCLATLINIIVQAPSETAYDIFTYDVEPMEGGVEWVSVFRRLTRLGLKSEFYNSKNGMALIAALEVLQKAGFFQGNFEHVGHMTATPSERNEAASTTKTSSGHDSLEVMHCKDVHLKIGGNDLLEVPEENRNVLMEHDRSVIIGLMIMWFQIILKHRRVSQMERLQSLIAHILMDTLVIEIFFSNNDHFLAESFTNWADEKEEIDPETVSWLRSFFVYCVTHKYCIGHDFVSFYGDNSSSLFQSNHSAYQSAGIPVNPNHGGAREKQVAQEEEDDDDDEEEEDTQQRNENSMGTQDGVTQIKDDTSSNSIRYTKDYKIFLKEMLNGNFENVLCEKLYRTGRGGESPSTSAAAAAAAASPISREKSRSNSSVENNGKSMLHKKTSSSRPSTPKSAIPPRPESWDKKSAKMLKNGQNNRRRGKKLPLLEKMSQRSHKGVLTPAVSSSSSSDVLAEYPQFIRPVNVVNEPDGEALLHPLMLNDNGAYYFPDLLAHPAEYVKSKMSTLMTHNGR